MTDDELLEATRDLWKRCCAARNPTAILSDWIERHRAEVEELRFTLQDERASGMSERFKLRAEVERLTRERDESKDEFNCVARHAIDEAMRAEAAESALAAAQKRVEVLEAAHRKIIEQQRGMWAVSPAMIARAALNESGNDDETVKQGQRGER